VLHEVVHGPFLACNLARRHRFYARTPIERMARDARVLTIGGGATEGHARGSAKRM